MTTLKDLIRAEVDADRFPELLELVYAVAKEKCAEHFSMMTELHVAANWKDGAVSRAISEMYTYLLHISSNYTVADAKHWRTRRDQTDAERDEAYRQERIAKAERDLEYAKRK